MQELNNEFGDALEEGRERRRRQLYGRRMGRGLTAELDQLLKAELPRLRVDVSRQPPEPLTALFPVMVEDVWLEVGFGGGEHLAWQAAHNPQIGFIGCEPFLTGVAKLVREVRDADLANLRLYDDDARQLLDWLPEASIGRIFVLFPDPWPKKRHHKRRFLHGTTLSSLARVMARGAHLRFATDIANYAKMVTEAMADRSDFIPHPGLHSQRPTDWPPTRYEGKAIDAGRVCQFFSFERV
jgi:tRNA (guanine-N7-)-methyltransferase